MNAAAIVYPEKNDPVFVYGAKSFIPISLGNHYYSKKILRWLTDDFVAKSQSSVIFLCDRLRFLSYKIRGAVDDEKINANIKIQVDQITLALTDVGLKAHSHATVETWEFVKNDPKYSRLLSRVNQLIEGDPTLQRWVDKYANRMIYRFSIGLGSNGQQQSQYQREYLIEETTLSLYMTEIQGFNFEIYRRGLGLVDDLYRDRPNDLMLILGKSKLDRRFIALEKLLQS